MDIDPTTLASQPFLKGMPEWMLKLLAAEAMPVEFKAGTPIFTAGGPANRFYLLLSGEVALETSADQCDDERKPLVIGTLGAGEVLGWSWLFPPYYWMFNARAVTPVRAIFFYGSRLRERCETDHELGYQLMKRTNKIVLGRLQATRRRLLEHY